MPYTKDELKSGKVDYYNEFIDELRSDYITKLANNALNEKPFRDNNNTLYSFEDITSGLGIEFNPNIRQDLNYSTLNLVLNEINISDDEIDFGTLIENNSISTQNELLKETIKDEKLDNLIDRKISELMIIETMENLPEEIENGDIVTSNVTTDQRKWLIEGNQKRIFPDLQTFYAQDDWQNVVTLTLEVINSIPSGEPVD
tara:strand:+ start:142 stop:744 length:603 start_codon:yes stop_codon:yes gene_type:complete